MTVRLLVVDDEPDVEVLFRQQFRREGLYLLDCALSGPAARDQLDGCIGQQIILLVSDINMPSMSGLDLIPEVKARRPDRTAAAPHRVSTPRSLISNVAAMWLRIASKSRNNHWNAR